MYSHLLAYKRMINVSDMSYKVSTYILLITTKFILIKGIAMSELATAYGTESVN